MDSTMFPLSRLVGNGIVMYPVSLRNCLNIPLWLVVQQSSLNTILAGKIRLWQQSELPRQRKKSSFAEADGTRSVQHWQVVLSTKTQADTSMKKSGFALSPYSYWAGIRSEYLFIRLTRTICIVRYTLSKTDKMSHSFTPKRTKWHIEEQRVWQDDGIILLVSYLFLRKTDRKKGKFVSL